jgi:FMN phosphatase YigB (HAD superfamily)
MPSKEPTEGKRGMLEVIVLICSNNFRNLSLIEKMRKTSLLCSCAFYLASKSQVFSLANKVKVTLITFDVDGTLIQGSSSAAEVASHARAFSYGVGSVFAKDNLVNFREQYPNPLSAVAKENYHGSTDGLIALHFAKNACGVSSEDAFPLLNEVFKKMFEFMSPLSDAETCRGIEVLPGVIDTLNALVRHKGFQRNLVCGLVTGNVEGIARKKMRACGILSTNILSRRSADQQKWEGEEDSSFLGGFGSDFCSGNINDASRIYKDRGEQIAIAYRRAKTLLAGMGQLHILL